jgi:hypothetical protein
MLKGSSLCLYSSNLGTFWLKIEQFWPFEDKFELYKHNDEPFNIYYGIFYELWTFADFDQLCKLEKRGMKLKKWDDTVNQAPVINFRFYMIITHT